MHKDITSATMQTQLAESLSNMGTQQLLGGPVLPDPRARHYDYPTSLKHSIVEDVIIHHQGHYNGL